MTFREYVEAEASWLERLWCRLFGHRVSRYCWSPTDEADDRRMNWAWCGRCGAKTEGRP